MRKLHVAVVQTGDCSDSDFTANINNLLEHFRREATPETDLVVFCELSTTPYFCATPTHNDRYFEWATPIPGLVTEQFAEICRETDTAVIVGAFEIDHHRDTKENRYYNSAFLLNRNGEHVLGNLPTGETIPAYRKLAIPTVSAPSLTTDEKYYFTPGQGPAIFELDNGLKVGILICYDRAFSEIWLALEHLGADIIVPVVSSLGWREELFVSDLRLRAMETGIWVVASNRGGPETCGGQTLDFFGRACIIAPTGEVVAEASAHQQPAVIRADIELETTPAAARKSWPIKEDRRPELFAFMYSNDKDAAGQEPA